MNLSKRIDELCNEKGITKRQAEIRSGLSSGTISRWQSGKLQPSQASLQKLSEFFGVDKAYITGESEIRNLKGVMVAALMQHNMNTMSAPMKPVKKNLRPIRSLTAATPEIEKQVKVPKLHQKYKFKSVTPILESSSNLNVGCRIPVINRLPVSITDTFDSKDQIGTELISPDYPAGKYFAVKLPEDVKGLADKGDIVIMVKISESNHNGLVLTKKYGFCTINKINESVFVLIPCDKSKKPVAIVKTQKVDVIAAVVEIRKKFLK